MQKERINMRNKKLFTTIVAAVITSSMLFTGCGQTDNKTDNAVVESGDVKTEETEETGETDASETDVEDVEDVSETEETEDAGEEAEEDTEEAEEDVEEETEEAEEDKYASIPVTKEDAPLSECYKLGEYKGLKLTKPEVEITDEMVKNYADQYAETEELADDAVVENGNIVNLDFEGKIDGKTFDGGSAEAYELEIGSDSFIDGFEDGMLGMKKGEEKDLNLKFPEDYGDEKLNGKDVVFHVKVNSISKKIEPSQQDMDKYRKELEDLYNSDFEESMKTQAWQMVQDNSELIQFRQKDLDDATAEIQKSLDEYLETNNIKFEDYLKDAEITEEENKKQIEYFAKETTEEHYLLESMMEAEGLSFDDPEQAEKEKEIAEGFSTGIDAIKEAGTYESFMDYVMQQRLVDKIVEYAEVTIDKGEDAEETFAPEDEVEMDDIAVEEPSDAESEEIAEEATEE